jgi:predicted HD phosphohydrolase
MSYTRMDKSTRADWTRIAAATQADAHRDADRLLALLALLHDLWHGQTVDQLTHALQTATRAERAGADDEIVLAALCHDAGHAYGPYNHAAVAAEVLRPYVRPEVRWMLQVHTDFVRRYHDRGVVERYAWLRHVPHRGFRLAHRFAAEWDQISFDPDYDTYPLTHFEPLVRRLTAHPRAPRQSRVRRHLSAVVRSLRSRAGGLVRRRRSVDQSESRR